MEEKTINVEGWTVRRSTEGAIFINHGTWGSSFVGAEEESAPKIARAILELCGEAPKEEPKRDNCYIAVKGKPYRWMEGRILAGITGEDIDAVKFWSESALSDGEFHIFRRVATVGPIPQPEREVTRYE